MSLAVNLLMVGAVLAAGYPAGRCVAALLVERDNLAAARWATRAVIVQTVCILLCVTDWTPMFLMIIVTLPFVEIRRALALQAPPRRVTHDPDV